MSAPKSVAKAPVYSAENFDPREFKRLRLMAEEGGLFSTAEWVMYHGWKPFAPAPEPDPDRVKRFGPETTLRPDVAGVAVRLADGRHWLFASPTHRLRPKFFEGLCTITGYVGYPPHIERALARLRNEEARGVHSITPEACYEAAGALLNGCHELEPGETAALLAGGIDDVARIFEGVCRAVRAGFTVEGEDDQAEDDQAAAAGSDGPVS